MAEERQHKLFLQGSLLCALGAAPARGGKNPGAFWKARDVGVLLKRGTKP